MNENPEDTADERDSRRSFLDEVTARPREIDVAMEEGFDSGVKILRSEETCGQKKKTISAYKRASGEIRNDFFKMICFI